MNTCSVSFALLSILNKKPQFYHLNTQSQNVIRDIFSNDIPECFIFIYVMPNCESCKSLLHSMEIIQQNYNNVYVLDLSGSPLHHVRNVYYPLLFVHHLDRNRIRNFLESFYISTVPRMDIFYSYHDQIFTFSNADIQNLAIYYKNNKSLSDFYKSFVSKTDIRTYFMNYEMSSKCLTK